MSDQEVLESDLDEDLDDDLELESIEDFISSSSLKMECLLLHENPHRLIRDQHECFHYSCKLMNGDRWIVVYFSKHKNIRLWRSVPEEFLSSGRPLHVPLSKIGTMYDGPMPPWSDNVSIHDRLLYDKCSVPEVPKISEVLQLVSVDSLAIDRTGMFEIWCGAMKCSSDSIHARRVWELCCQTRLRLQALLGDGEYHRLLYEIDHGDLLRSYGFSSSSSSSA